MRVLLASAPKRQPASAPPTEKRDQLEDPSQTCTHSKNIQRHRRISNKSIFILLYYFFYWCQYNLIHSVVTENRMVSQQYFSAWFTLYFLILLQCVVIKWKLKCVRFLHSVCFNSTCKIIDTDWWSWQLSSRAPLLCTLTLEWLRSL